MEIEKMMQILEMQKKSVSEVERLKCALDYFQKHFEDPILMQGSEEEKIFKYCNGIKHVLMDSYEKMVKIETEADRICRFEE